jgi:hypothetical protein
MEVYLVETILQKAKDRVNLYEINLAGLKFKIPEQNLAVAEAKQKLTNIKTDKTHMTALKCELLKERKFALANICTEELSMIFNKEHEAILLLQTELDLLNDLYRDCQIYENDLEILRFEL